MGLQSRHVSIQNNVYHTCDTHYTPTHSQLCSFLRCGWTQQMLRLFPAFCYHSAHTWNKPRWILPICPQRPLSYSLPYPPHNIWVTSPHICKRIHKVSGNNVILSILWCSSTLNRIFLVRGKRKPLFFKGKMELVYFWICLPKKKKKTTIITKQLVWGISF